MSDKSTKRGPLYLPATKTAQRYGVTTMTVWRWENDPELGFPQPIYIGRSKFHVIAELDAWDAARPRVPQRPAVQRRAAA